MRKSCFRDYAIEAFRFFARVGGSEEYQQQVWNEAIETHRTYEERRGSGVSRPTEAAVIRAERAIVDAKPAIADLKAVESTLALLNRYKTRAVKDVYMAEPHKRLERQDISNRVHKASLSIPASESTVYHWLAEARTTFAIERGLRIE